MADLKLEEIDRKIFNLKTFEISSSSLTLPFRLDFASFIIRSDPDAIIFYNLNRDDDNLDDNVCLLVSYGNMFPCIYSKDPKVGIRINYNNYDTLSFGNIERLTSLFPALKDNILFFKYGLRKFSCIDHPSNFPHFQDTRSHILSCDPDLTMITFVDKKYDGISLLFYCEIGSNPLIPCIYKDGYYPAYILQTLVYKKCILKVEHGCAYLMNPYFNTLDSDAAKKFCTIAKLWGVMSHFSEYFLEKYWAPSF